MYSSTEEHDVENEIKPLARFFCFPLFGLGVVPLASLELSDFSESDFMAGSWPWGIPSSLFSASASDITTT